MTGGARAALLAMGLAFAAGSAFGSPITRGSGIPSMPASGPMAGELAPAPPPPQPPPPPPSGLFSFLKSAAIGAPNSSVQVSIQRLGGAVGAYGLYYSLIGEGCASPATAGPVRFEDGDTAVKTVSVMLAAKGVCSAILVSPSEVMGTPRAIALTVVPVVAGCPLPQDDVVFATLGGFGSPILQRQRSGQALFLELPATSAGHASGQLTFGESASASTPQPVTLEISISKCPGVIGNDYANFCNLRSTNGSYNSITWFSREASGITGSNANSRGYCWAGDGGQYYANARWTFSSCPGGEETCGFAIQANDGPF